MLKYSIHNQKLNRLARYLGLHLNQVVSFDLPAGWTCSKADICKTFVYPKKGTMKKVGRIMCYAAKCECYAPSVRVMRWENFNILKTFKNDSILIANELEKNLPKTAKIVRIHSSGDFYSQAYFVGWIILALRRKDITFFGYTKHLDYCISELPPNMFLQYSHGSKDDKRAEKLEKHIPTCYIAEYEGQYPSTLPVVCDSHDTAHEDYFCILSKTNFVINLH
jgi:hypothetical protein